MATRKIKDAKDLITNELIYFKGHAKATYMSNGSTVEDAINNIEIGDIDLSDYAKKSDLSNVATSGSYNDLTNKPTIPAVVTESTVSGWGFTKNTGTYIKPSTGIPKTDLASAVQTSLGKADTALQTETYKGTITGVSANGTSIATSGVANIPAASTSAYGVTKLSSSTSSTSTSLAATASAVKSAYDLANGKQDKLVSGTNIKTINGTSILGSGNIVISGGGSSSGNGAYAEVNHGTNDTTFTLTPNTFHVWDEVASLTLTLGSETAGVANEYLFQFISGANAITLSLPSDLKWTDELVIEANRIYQVSILNGLASVLSWDSVNTALIENHITYDVGNFMNGGTITFEYPTASELTFGMDYYSSSTFIVPQGSTQVNIDWNEPSAPIIKSISPTEDLTYKYILL